VIRDWDDPGMPAKKLTLYPRKIVKGRVGLAVSCCEAGIYVENCTKLEMESGGGSRGVSDDDFCK